MKMRKLLAHEIETRVGTVSKSKPKAMLLLYKDARCDMAILDEVYGPENWQCEFVFMDKKSVITKTVNKTMEIIDKYDESVLFCKIGVYNKELGQWVWKQSNGVESEGTGEDDKNNVKGEASDSFKRAGFMWGIGRELYEWKDLWIDYDKQNDKYERYRVTEISYDDKDKPKSITIVNSKNQIVYQMTNGRYKKPSGSVKDETPNADTKKEKKADTSQNNASDDNSQASEEPKNTKEDENVILNRVKKNNRILYVGLVERAFNIVKQDEQAKNPSELAKRLTNEYFTYELKIPFEKLELVEADKEPSLKGLVVFPLTEENLESFDKSITAQIDLPF
jgi:hypothetical protein